ncbi:MAG: DUF4956 domain-containing protein [Bacteroidaceae bacterium]|nr:DUF4956 domain-containing protein [Bacteroidaceae bacterium]
MEALNEFLTMLSGDTFRLLDLIMRLVINTAFIIVIARYFYFPKARRRDFFFTYVLLGFCIFMLIHLMSDSKMKTGIAMGLFAIFCIMRYRTESVPIREMTYLFLIISLAAINGLAWSAGSAKDGAIAGPLLTSMGELVLTNLIFVLGVWVAEAGKFVKSLSSKYVKYDKIDLIKPERRDELIADLKERTGLDITSVAIGSIDFLKDMALIKIYYNTDEDDESAQKMPKSYE